MFKSNRSYKPHPNKVNPNYANTAGVQFRVNISDPNTWKGNKNNSDISNNVFNSGAPTDSRPPLQPVSGSGPLYRRGKRTSAPNPIRHWRKQLQPQQGYVSGKAGVGQVMDRPGGSVILKSNNASCDPDFCIPSLATYVPANYVKELDVDNCWNMPSNIYAPTTVKKIICDPEQRARQASRYASTNLSKKYYTTGKAYLRSRVKLLEQNQTLSQIPGNTYIRLNSLGGGQHQPIAANNYVIPTDSKTTGSQLYNSTNCVEDASKCCPDETCQTQVIYKPSNYLFAHQGAVSSSSRIARLKYNAITKNNVNLMTMDGYGNKTNLSVNGQELYGSTPKLYRGNTIAPYFVKSKYQLANACNPGSASNRKNSIAGLYPGSRMPSGGTGIKTVCFLIPNKSV